jgi:methylenetetrahydrofolate reductase (NADPH)
MNNGYRFLHMYTMNLEKSIIDIIKGLGILDEQKPLPFKRGSSRADEEVRPIFWAIKPKSYIARTQEWDEYPNGRWGVSRSPAFGDMEKYWNFSGHNNATMITDNIKLWGDSVTSFDNISKVFIDFVQGKIKKYPFSEGCLQIETKTI